MTTRAYLSDVTPWWTMERQEAALADVLPTASVFRDALDRRQRQGHSMADLVQRKRMLQSTMRPVIGEVVHVASLAVLAWSEDDLQFVLTALVARGAALISAEGPIAYQPLGVALFPRIVEDWKRAKAKSRFEGAPLRGGDAIKAKRAAVYGPRFARIEDRWGNPDWPTDALLAEAGDDKGKPMSRNTANKYAGMTREKAIAGKEEELKRKEAQDK